MLEEIFLFPTPSSYWV